MAGPDEGVDWLTAYVAAVVSGSCAFLAMFAAAIAVIPHFRIGVVGAIELAKFLFIPLTLFVGFTGLLPICWVRSITIRVPVNSMGFFIFFGGLVSLFQAVLLKWVYLQDLEMNLVWIGVPSGALAGYVFWLLNGRYAGRRHARPASR